MYRCDYTNVLSLYPCLYVLIMLQVGSVIGTELAYVCELVSNWGQFLLPSSLDITLKSWSFFVYRSPMNYNLATKVCISKLTKNPPRTCISLQPFGSLLFNGWFALARDQTALTFVYSVQIKSSWQPSFMSGRVKEGTKFRTILLVKLNMLFSGLYGHPSVFCCP